MAFFNSAVNVLQTLVIALGAGLGIWGVINLLEGYGNDNPGAKSQGIKQSVDTACLFSRGGYYEIEDEDTELPATLSFCPSTDKCCSVFMKWDHQANCLKDST